MIQEGVDIVKNMSFWRLLSRGYTKEVLNRGLYTSLIQANYGCRKTDRGRGGGKWLSMVMTYTQVDNNLGIHLRYLKIM